MDAASAEDQLRMMVAADKVPYLVDSEIGVLLQIAAATGLHAAAAEGWRWKAAKVAGEYAVTTTDGQHLDRDQIHGMCLAMAAQYSRSRLGTVDLVGPTAQGC